MSKETLIGNPDNNDDRWKILMQNSEEAVLIINGPNLNFLGIRETDKYGSVSYEELINKVRKEAGLGRRVEFFQSNLEGEIVNFIQKARNDQDGIIINAGGYTHTSVAIRDALDIFKKPIIELHISNIYKREDFRHKSLISSVATAGIFGLGTNGYILAINAMHELLKNGN